MKPGKFPEANKELKAPAGMDNCGSLHVLNDGQTSVSLWKADWRDRLRILFTGEIWLGVMFGATQQPVFITTDKPVAKVIPETTTIPNPNSW